MNHTPDNISSETPYHPCPPSLLINPPLSWPLAACASRIERQLNKVPCVEAPVNFSIARAYVRYASNQVSVDQLVSAVSKTGYTATPSNTETRAAEQQAKQVRYGLNLANCGWRYFSRCRWPPTWSSCLRRRVMRMPTCCRAGCNLLSLRRCNFGWAGGFMLAGCISCVAPPIPRGEATLWLTAPGDYIARLAQVFHVKKVGADGTASVCLNARFFMQHGLTIRHTRCQTSPTPQHRMQWQG